MKRVVVVLLVLAMLLIFVGCQPEAKQEEAVEDGGQTQETAEEQTVQEEAEEEQVSAEAIELAFVIPSTESQYWAQYLGTGVENACIDIKEKYGVDVNMTVYGPATEAETDKYISTLETVISKKPDAIVMGNLQPDAVALLVKQANEQGIYVNLVSIGITGNEDSYGSLYDCDQPEQGIIAADALFAQIEAKGLPLDGVIGVHMSVVVPILEEKIQKFRDRMAELAPDMQLLETVYNENDVNNAQANVENQIATYGDEIVGFFGANNISGDGIALAVKNADIGENIASVAVDSDELEIQALIDGDLGAIVVQTPYAQGYSATMNVYEYLVNGTMDEKRVNLSAKVVTKENMEEEEFAALLNPLILKK